MTDTGGPAFPCGLQSGHLQPLHKGMTLRDYFAAKAMQGAIANEGLSFSKKWLEQCSADSYAVADAMLKARNT